MIEFVHERLEAYRVAREFLARAHQIGKVLPRGEAAIADQLDRAASSILLNCAEGVGRRAGRDKARFFDIARGSATECAAVLDVLEIRELAPAHLVSSGRALLHLSVRLLSGLARSALTRAATDPDLTPE